MNGLFEPTYSTNHIWFDEEFDQCLTLHLESMQTDIDGKASTSHTHTGYASSNHTHDGYANVTHSHSEYAAINHEHDGYATSDHTHSYNDLTDKPTIPSTDGLATTTYVDNAVADISSITVDDALSATSTNPVQNKVINSALDNKADTSHSHLLSDFGFQYGKVAVQCTANQVSTANVTFDKTYTTMPIVTLTAGSSAPGTAIQEVTVSNITYTGFTVNVYRTNTSVTTVQWMAAGQV